MFSTVILKMTQILDYVAGKDYQQAVVFSSIRYS